MLNDERITLVMSKLKKLLILFSFIYFLSISIISIVFKIPFKENLFVYISFIISIFSCLIVWLLKLDENSYKKDTNIK